MAIWKAAHIYLCVGLLAVFGSSSAHAQRSGSITADDDQIIFLSVGGAQSRLHSLVLTNTSRAAVAINPIVPLVNGRTVLSFERTIPGVINPGQSASLFIRFTPDSNAVGVVDDALVFETVGNGTIRIPIRALSIASLNTRDEPPLADIFQTLGYSVDPGWRDRIYDVGLPIAGDQIPHQIFEKAGPGLVTILPVARFSRNGDLPFGYYPVNDLVPELRRIGVLAESDEWHQHKTLQPKLKDGVTSFDPGNEQFGLFVEHPDHVTYAENRWNKQFSPEYAAQAVRVYPARSADGIVEENAYLVCMEETDDGDYQDIVFLVSNVEPANGGQVAMRKLFQPVTNSSVEPEFRPLLQPDNLDGWITYLKAHGRNRDPNSVFEVSNGELRIAGAEIGYLRTEEAFESFHLKFDYRFTDEQRSRRDKTLRDAGVIYYVEEAQIDHIWPRGIEFDLREQDAGDIWLHAGTTLKSSGSVWGAGRPARVVKSSEAENPVGEWNSAEIVADNGQITHIINGVMVNGGNEASVRRGRILLQSAGTEIYFRNVEVRKWRPEPTVAGSNIQR